MPNHSGNTGKHGADSSRKGKERAESGQVDDPVPSHAQDHGVLHQMASSASRLARNIANTSGPGAELDALAAAKTGQTEGRYSMTRECSVDNGYNRIDRATEPLSLAGANRASAAFRQASRTAVAQDNNSPPEGLNKEHVQERQDGDAPTNMAFTTRPTQSHQVKLAEDLDGHGVIEFLSQRTPTSMSTGGISVLAGSGFETSAQYQDIPAPDLNKPADPVSYLQGTTYATDMEALDHHVPRERQKQTTSASAPSASPSGLAKAWDEHSASILEEWELNEAWDRAWMDTTWSSVQKKEKPGDKEASAPADLVLPSNKNLSYLLKPRI